MGIKSLVRQLVWPAAQIPVLRRAVIGYYEWRAASSPWSREHPFDLSHGVHTSGVVPGHVLTKNGRTAYAAAQPSIIRAGLATIPDPAECHFVDMGCGKGRPLLVATEFGFASITGVEISPALCQMARRNADQFARSYPDRRRIEIVTSDALAYTLPAGKLVVFLYNPFEEPLIAQLLSRVEASLQANPRDLYIVYYNPVWSGLFDASNALERRYAAQVPYDPSEIGYGMDESDALAVWQNLGNPHPRPSGGNDARIVTTAPGVRAEIMQPA